jgi:CheY-like chemotaxis protein
MSEKKVMIVLAEDNPGDVYLVRRALDFEGLDYDLTVAKDGEAAIDLVTEVETGSRTIDLFMVDLDLPKRDGTEVLTRARQSKPLEGVPIVMLTSSDSPHDRKRCLQLGANRFFRKPSDLHRYMEIGKIVRELLQPHATPAIG